MKEINAQPKIFSRNILEYFKEIPKNWTVLDTYSVYVCLVNKVEIVDVDVVFKTRIHGHSKWKNNLGTFIKHIFFRILPVVFQGEHQCDSTSCVRQSVQVLCVHTSNPLNGMNG